MALRIAALPDSTLIARRLCQVRRLVVGAPAYFDRRGRPTHPSELANHDCLGYAYLRCRRPGDLHMSVVTRWWSHRAARCAQQCRCARASPMVGARSGGPTRIHGVERYRGRPARAGIARVVAAPHCLALGHTSGKFRPVRVDVLIDFLVERLTTAPWAKQSEDRLPAVASVRPLLPP